jgi:hypothetical protein
VRRGRFAGTYHTLANVVSRHNVLSHIPATMHPASRRAAWPSLNPPPALSAPSSGGSLGEAPGAASPHAPSPQDRSAVQCAAAWIGERA